MKKYEFRKGDKVICIDNSCVEEYLEKGKEYTFEKKFERRILRHVIFLKEFPFLELFAHRFELSQKVIVEYL